MKWILSLFSCCPDDDELLAELDAAIRTCEQLLESLKAPEMKK